MTASMSVTLVNDRSEVERLGRLVEAFGEKQGLRAEAIFSINLALDEVVTNIIRYAHDDDGRQHPILVRLALEQDVLTAEVEDDGRAFNPLDAPVPDIGAGIEDRSIGGLGIHLVRSVMSCGGIPARGRTERPDDEEETVNGRPSASAAGLRDDDDLVADCDLPRPGSAGAVWRDVERNPVVAGLRHRCGDRDPGHVGCRGPHTSILQRTSAGNRIARLNHVEAVRTASSRDVDTGDADGIAAASLRDANVLTGRWRRPSDHHRALARIGIVVREPEGDHGRSGTRLSAEQCDPRIGCGRGPRASRLCRD